jgi:hypothetical protein
MIFISCAWKIRVFRLILQLQKKSKMNLLNFISQYSDEASCRAKFKEYRDKKGVVCPHCGSRKVLPWMHIDISNAKRILLAIYQYINFKYLQSYPNELRYKFNRIIF